MADVDSIGDLFEYVTDRIGPALVDAKVTNGELTLRVERDQIVKALAVLRDDPNCQFKQLMDIAGVDFPERERRFDVVYNLLSLTGNMRVRVIVETDEETPVPSVTELYSSAGWFEREAWDLYGIFFSNHPDLRRILTD